MPIQPPSLDDRNFDDLVEELLARIPAHTPEWNPRLGDPGRTLIELFAWLGDTLLYRANLIPERQRLAFLRLLGIPLRPAIPAQGVISVLIDNPEATGAIALQPQATVKGPVNFETLTELTVFPVTVAAFYKRRLLDEETNQFAAVVADLQQLYNLSSATPYITTPIFADGTPEAAGFNLAARSLDQCLWLALLAPKPELVEAVKQALGTTEGGGQPLLNVGIMPAIAVPALFEDIGPRAQIPHVWELSTGREFNGQPEYLTLNVAADSSAGLTRQGVLRLVMPAPNRIGAPSNDVRAAIDAGVGDRPPRLDSPELAARLVTWLRLRPTLELTNLSLSWVGLNAVEIDQRQTLSGRVIGQSNGLADQEMVLPGQSVAPETFELQVEEPGRGYQPWQPIADLALAGRDAAVYFLDSEAGTVRFGDGVRGRIPDPEMRVRVAKMRSGGGRSGNLPPGSLTEIRALDRNGDTVSNLKAFQPLPTQAGADAETTAEAERRIPALFRHRDRAVTATDYRQLAATAPGVQIGRVEVLPRFKPQQRRSNVPGVVSVMVLPQKAAVTSPNPRPDRPLLETVHAYLEARRPLGTELYVIGCEYIPLGLSVGVDIQDGFGRDGVLQAVRDTLHQFLWPLVPGDATGTGWALGKTVQERELEVVVARVAGVRAVRGVLLFQELSQEQNSGWQRIPAPGPCLPAELRLEAWQLPELLAVVVTDGEAAPDLVARPAVRDAGVAVPVVPEVC